jgi:ABC-type dipeptide/oligopeptide/nickel transport system permease component
VDRLLHGDLGYSYKLNQSIASLFEERWARSLYLSGTSLLLGAVLTVLGNLLADITLMIADPQVRLT